MRASGQPAAAASGQCASRPCRCRALARGRKASGFFMTHLLQLVIDLEGMRTHGLVARLDMRRQGEGNRWGLLAVIAAAFERQANRGRAWHITLKRLDDGGIELAPAAGLPRAGPERRAAGP